jgi:hypothetical protein
MADIISPEYYLGRHRKIAQRIKDPFDGEAMEIAAKAMAPLVPAGAVLVPAPDSTGTVKANEYLAGYILQHLTGALVRTVVRRVTPVASSRLLRRAGGRGLSIEEHVASMAQIAPLPPGRPIVVIDNVAMEGNTINAIEQVLGVPVLGIVYAIATRRPEPEEVEAKTDSPSIGAPKKRHRRLRLCVTGSRKYNAVWKIERYLETLPKNIVIVHGGASGADAITDLVARELGFRVEIVPANWERYGRAAGPIRNREMIESCSHVVAFWDGESRGTASAIEAAEEFGIDVEIIMDEEGEDPDFGGYSGEIPT